jgi:glycosyltransferase involved in cell wall biosynthesis
MAVVRRRHPSARLVVVGSATPHQELLAQEAARLGIAEAVHFPGWIDANDLEGLYQSASCFVLPSLREGFGLPILEAMARGVPVACSNVSALPEVAGNAARYFDPDRHEEIAAAVIRLLEQQDETARLVAAGKRRSGRFTWRRTAEATLEAYDRAWSTRNAGC